MGDRINHWIRRASSQAKVASWTCKGLRHLAITNMLNSGVEVQTVARLVGNSPKTIWSTYAQVFAGRPEASMESIGRRAAGNVIAFRGKLT